MTDGKAAHAMTESADDLLLDDLGEEEIDVSSVDDVGDEDMSTPEPIPANERGERAVERRSRELVPLDPFRRYMEEVRHYPLLTREEEHALAVKYYESGDAETAFRMVTANLRLVVKIALEYQHAYQNLLDLVQEGNVGLMQAVKKYNPYRGIRLSSYAQWWIRAYILKFLMDNFTLVKVGTTQAQRKLFYNLKKEKDRMEQEGLDLDAATLAERLDVRERDVVEMERRLAGGREVSLHTPIKEGEKGELMDTISTTRNVPEDHVARDEVSELLSSKLGEFRETLDTRDQIIWDERLMADEPKTLQEVGDMFGVSRERARQLESRLLKRLRKYLQEQIHDIEDLGLELMGVEEEPFPTY